MSGFRNFCHFGPPRTPAKYGPGVLRRVGDRDCAIFGHPPLQPSMARGYLGEWATENLAQGYLGEWATEKSAPALALDSFL